MTREKQLNDDEHVVNQYKTKLFVTMFDDAWCRINMAKTLYQSLIMTNDWDRLSIFNFIMATQYRACVNENISHTYKDLCPHVPRRQMRQKYCLTVHIFQNWCRLLLSTWANNFPAFSNSITSFPTRKSSADFKYFIYFLYTIIVGTTCTLTRRHACIRRMSTRSCNMHMNVLWNG